MHCPRVGDRSGIDAVRRTDVRIGSHGDWTHRRADYGAEATGGYHHCDAQYAAGRAGVGLHGFYVRRPDGRVRPDRQDVHESLGQTDGRLRHRQVRLTAQEEVSMHRHIDEELSDLKQELLRMGALVEEQIERAIRSLVDRDTELASRVIERDKLVNRFDVEIDETCIRLLALQAPAARDLRFVTTAMKISTELERMSDLAENICERVIELNEEPQLKPYIDIPRMANRAMQMVREALDAFVRYDAALARKVCADDDFVDDLTHQLFRELLSFMLENPATITRAIRLTFIGKYIERIADHATNISELVIYMVEGKIVRHTPPPVLSDNQTR